MGLGQREKARLATKHNHNKQADDPQGQRLPGSVVAPLACAHALARVGPTKHPGTGQENMTSRMHAFQAIC